jgi:hypothetical protein
MQHLFFSSFLLSAFVLLLLLVKHPFLLRDAFLGSIFSMLAIHSFVIFLIQKNISVPWLYQMSESLLFLDGLFFWLFTRSLLNLPTTTPKFWYHLLPFVISYVCCVLSGSEAVLFLNRYGGLTSTAFYLILALALLRKRQDSIFTHFSTLKYNQFEWLKYAIYLFLGVLVVNAISQVLYLAHAIFLPQFGNLISNITLAIVILILSFNCIRHGFIVILKEAESSNSEKKTEQIYDPANIRYGKDALPRNKLEDYYEKIEAIMRIEKPYLNPDLNLQNLFDVS